MGPGVLCSELRLPKSCRAGPRAPPSPGHYRYSSVATLPSRGPIVDLGEGRCDYQFASCIACEIHSSSHTALAATRAAAATVTTAAITAAAFSPTVVTRPSRARSDDTRSLKSHATYNTSPAIGTHTTVSPSLAQLSPGAATN